MMKIGLMICLVLTSLTVSAQAEYGKEYIKRIGEMSSTYVSRRPAEKERLFRSDVIDKKIKEVQKLLKDNEKLAWMFGNCF
ncbi:MAG: metal-independent alpha-mannosidase, partial [Bacteroidaceae bacterium]|nr:metal-independent alpha-mannosidase [Bacteroidaceae bacterium]